MEAIKTFWSKAMEMPSARLFIALVGLAVLLIVVYYVVMLFRNMAIGGEDPTNYLVEFKRLHEDGELDDEEYSRLAKVIPEQILPDLDKREKHAD